MKNYKFTNSLIIIVFSIAFTGFYSVNKESEGKIKLGYGDSNLKSIKYNYENSFIMEMSMGGMKQTTSLDVVGELNYKNSKPENYITHDISFSNAKFIMISGIGEQTPESKSFLNKSFLIKTGINGQSQELLNIDDHPVLGEAPLPPVFELKDLIIEFPKKLLSINDTWNSMNSYKIKYAENEFDNSIESTFKLESFENKYGYECAKITGKSTLIMSGIVKTQGMDMEVEFESMSKITIYFAYKKGFPVEFISEGEGKVIFIGPSNSFEMNGTYNDSKKFTYIPGK